ncbi:MAG: hypothetical protein SCI25_13975 [Desulfuromonadales bacterium]|nr:hypothetical protein [Desulfuromonadales bacterium]
MVSEIHKDIKFKNIILIIVFSLPFLIKINDYDIWYHMVIGREIVNTGSIPSSEFYIYSLLGQSSSFHEWGFGLFYYLIYNWFGIHGLNIVNAIIGGIVLFVLYQSIDTKSNFKNYLKIIFILLVVFFIKTRFIFRPENFLFLAMSLEIFFLEKFRSTNDRKFLFYLPLLTLFLNNIHPSAIFLIGIMGAYFIQFLIDNRHESDKKNKLIFLFIIFLSVISSCANPYGFEQLFLPISFIMQNKVLKVTEEFMPLWQSDYIYLFSIYFVISFFSFLIKGNKKIVYFILFSVFGILAYKYTRNIALFVIVMYVPNVKGYTNFFETYLEKFNVIKLKVFIFIIVLLASLVTYFTYFIGGWGFGIVDHLFPIKIARMLKQKDGTGNIFNYYSYGGYLGWVLNGKNLVAIDGRHYYYDKSWREHDEIITMRNQWSTLLDENNIKYIVIPTMLWNSEVFPIIHYLYGNKEWLLLAEDYEALLFERSNSKMTLSKNVLDKNKIWHHVINISHYFSNERIKNLNLGISYYKLKQYKNALYHFKIYRQYSPDDKEINMIIQQLEKMGF